LLRVTLALILLLLSAAPASAQNPWLQRRVLNIAHQGGEDEFPSNTMYAFQHSVKAGADMLELDVGVTKDNKVVVMHDTTLDRTTNGHGTIASHTLKQIRKLDAGYWFAGGKAPYDHRAKRHPFRGKGLKVPTLQEVIKAFPKTPINVEIKGRTKAEKPAEYIQNAEVLARLLKNSPRRDIIVVSFSSRRWTGSTSSRRRSRSRPASTAPRAGSSTPSRPATAWSRSSSRSPTPSAARSSTSPRRTTWRARTPRATRGTRG
jgi:glycerophosphoryl diester phosphodiesterase